MSERLTPGLMRLSSRKEVVQCNHNFDTRIVGFVRIHLPIAYAEPFQQSASHWMRHNLWKALTVGTEAVAPMIVNSVFLITVTRSYMSIETKDDNVNPQIVGANTKLLFTPKTPIGFVHTCPEMKDVNVPPYLLLMDENNHVSIGGKSPHVLVDAVEYNDVRPYKSLISANRPATYMSKNGPEFLQKKVFALADIMAAIANIGVLKILGATLIVGLLIAAFAIGGGSRGGKGGNGGGNSNDQSNNEGNA